MSTTCPVSGCSDMARSRSGLVRVVGWTVFRSDHGAGPETVGQDAMICRSRGTTGPRAASDDAEAGNERGTNRGGLPILESFCGQPKQMKRFAGFVAYFQAPFGTGSEPWN